MLECAGNRLTTLDLRENTALTWLACAENYMPNRSALTGYSGFLDFDPQKDPSTLPEEEEAKPQRMQPAAPTAKSAAPEVLVNGKRMVFDAYNIDGSNHFKLRDLAYALNGTEKQFEVGYDNVTKAITLTSGKAYTPVGDEMAAKATGDKTPMPGASEILLDGGAPALTSYSIDGSNYFKLRDLARALDFGVTYDAATKAVGIDTRTGYGE